MKIYNAQVLWDYDVESIGIYDSLEKAIDDLLNTFGSYDSMFIDEQESNSMCIGERVWDRDDEGVEVFYA